MAQFTIEIPDQLLPALVVEFGLVQGITDATTPEEYFQASIVETVRQRAEAYKVGPYYVGSVDRHSTTLMAPTWRGPRAPAGSRARGNGMTYLKTLQGIGGAA
jgi:hypothetical protein